jgi:hypothetical protein
MPDTPTNCITAQRKVPPHRVFTQPRSKAVIDANVASHGRYVTFQLAGVAVPRSLFQKILGLIHELR